MATVSVIIPNFNNSRHLAACLHSCIDQAAGQTCEIIVVDDASTDDSLEVLHAWQKRFPEQIRVFQNPAKGANTARNYGYAQSSGDFIQWLDSDDFLLPGKWQTQIAWFTDHPQTDVVYSDWRSDYYRDGVFSHREEVKGQACSDYLLQLVADIWQPCHSYLMRRHVAAHLMQLQAWNPATRVAQDREYFMTAAMQGYVFDYVPGMFCVYNRWQHSGSISGMPFRERLGLQFAFEHRMWLTMKQFRHIDPQKQRQYEAHFNTHTLEAGFYYPSLPILRPYSLFLTSWKTVHWKKLPFLPLIYFWQHVGLFFRKIRIFGPKHLNV